MSEEIKPEEIKKFEGMTVICKSVREGLASCDLYHKGRFIGTKKVPAEKVVNLI